MLRKALPRLLEFNCQKNTVLFSTSAATFNEKSYKFVIAGGGAGGITIASQLLHHGQKHFAVIEPSDVHYYQPYFTLVGGRLKEFEDSFRPMKDVMPQNVEWIKDEVVGFDPASNLVHTKNGDKIKYEYLIVAMGMRLAFEQVKGLREAFNTKGVCSNYSPMTVTKTAQAIQDFKEGNAIFTQPINPIKCGGAPQKIMYLADANFREAKKRKNANIIFNTALSVFFPAPKYEAVLKNIAKNKGITVNYLHNLVEVRYKSHEAVFEKLKADGSSSGTEIFKYEMLHVTPPMQAPDAIKESPLSDAAGYVDVNKYTLQHNKFKNVFAIGDCSNVPTSKTAAAVAGQSGILINNLMSVVDGQNLSQMYYGYTSCPLVTGNKKGVLAEFDYDLKPVETLPFDQGKESYLSYILKVDVVPFIYWNMMLKGRWVGPGLVRKLLHFGSK